MHRELSLLRLSSLIGLFCCMAAVSQAEVQTRFEAANGETVAAFQGQLQVLENRNDPDSRLISIEYVRFPATGMKPGSPIVYLSGGPGGSGIETARYDRFPLFMAMREFGDVIALDQRGTGASNQLPDCVSKLHVVDSQAYTDAAFVNLHRQAAMECFEYWDNEQFDFRGYTTRQSALDLEDLRNHLGADKISLWGISYGSHLSLAAIKLLGDRIDRVVLASVEGLAQTVKMPARTDAYFSRLQAAVNADSQLAPVYPDIAGLMRRVHARLDEQPSLLTLNFENGSQAPYLLEARDLQMIAAAMIADPSSALLLLSLYAELDNGATSTLAGLLAQFHAPDEPITYRPMSLAMDIASGISRTRFERVEAEARTALLAAYLNFPMPQLADVIPALDLGEEFRRPPVSDVPVLVLSGTLDGRTYPESQREAVAGLRNAQIVTVRNAGHNLFMSSAEVAERIASFMRDETSATSDITVGFNP